MAAAVFPLNIVNGTSSQTLTTDTLAIDGIEPRSSGVLLLGGSSGTEIRLGGSGLTTLTANSTSLTTVNIGTGAGTSPTVHIADASGSTSQIYLGAAGSDVYIPGTMTVTTEAAFDGDTTIGSPLGTDGDTLTVYAMTTFTPGRVTGSIDFLKETASHALTVQDSTTRTVAGSSLTVRAAAGASDGGVGGVLSLKSGAGGDLIQGTGVTFATDGTTTTFVSTQALFVAGDVGRTIRIAGSTTNDGDFPITSYISSTSVTWLTGSGSSEAATGTWEFTSVIGQAGGALSILGGSGGAGSADLAAGAGGALTLSAGGAGAGAVGGAGGALTLSSGAPTGTGSPGTVAVQFGGTNILTVDVQGNVALNSIADDSDNKLDLSTGNNSAKSGGALNIFTGNGGSGSGPKGGKISITAGNGGSGSGTAEGGPVWITAGNGTTGGASTGGAVQITAGNGGTVTGGNPGGITITGGNSTMNGASGGNVTLDVGTYSGFGVNPPRILIGGTNAEGIYSGRGATYNTTWNHRGALNVLTAANAQQFQIQDDAGGTPKLRLDMTSTGTAGTAPVAAWGGRLDAGTSKYTAIFSFGEDTFAAVPDPIMTFISGATPEGAITAPEGSTCHVQYATANANDGLWVKSTGVGNTGWAQVATGTGGGATLQTAYDTTTPTIALDGSGGIQFNQADGAGVNAATLSLTNAEDGTNNNTLTVNRSPVTSVATGDGVGITMGANAAGSGLSVAHAGSGTGLFVNGTGSGTVADIQYNSASVLQVTSTGAFGVAAANGTAGAAAVVRAGNGTSGAGGTLVASAGSSATGAGGVTSISSGDVTGATASTNGGVTYVVGGSALGANSTGNGGSLQLWGGNSVHGTPGNVEIKALTAALEQSPVINRSGTLVDFTQSVLTTNTGTNNVLTFSTPTVTLTNTTDSPFLLADTGRYFTIAGATSVGNNGTFQVTYLSATQVTYSNANAVPETFGAATTWTRAKDMTASLVLFENILGEGGLGVKALPGSIGLSNNGGVGKVYVKTGAADTAWSAFSTADSLQAVYTTGGTGSILVTDTNGALTATAASGSVTLTSALRTNSFVADSDTVAGYIAYSTANAADNVLVQNNGLTGATYSALRVETLQAATNATSSNATFSTASTTAPNVVITNSGVTAVTALKVTQTQATSTAPAATFVTAGAATATGVAVTVTQNSVSAGIATGAGNPDTLVTAEAGSIYLSSAGALYIRDTAGSGTSWAAIGTTSGSTLQAAYTASPTPAKILLTTAKTFELQAPTGTTVPAMTVTMDSGSTNSGIEITQSGTAVGSHGLKIVSNQITSSNANLLYVDSQNASAVGPAAFINNAGTGYGLAITQGGTGTGLQLTSSNATGQAAVISNVATSSSVATLTVNTTGSSSTGNSISISHANGTGYALGVVKSAGSGAAANISNLGTGYALAVWDSTDLAFSVDGSGAVSATPPSGQNVTLTTLGAGVVDINSASNITVDAATYIAIAAGSGAFNLGNTAKTDIIVIQATGGVTVAPKSGQDFTVDTAGAGTISLDAYVASNFTVTGGHLTLSTVTSGNVILATAGASDDITFKARGIATPIPFNGPGAGTYILDGAFTATSIVGALNELKTGVTTVSQLVSGGWTTTNVPAGYFGYISANNTVSKAIATTLAQAMVMGANEGTAGSMTTAGTVEAIKLDPTSTAVNAGDRLFISAVAAGTLTKVAPVTIGQVVRAVGMARTAGTGGTAPTLLAVGVDTFVAGAPVTLSATAFSAGDVGRVLCITGATVSAGANNGYFEILSVIPGVSCTYTNASAVNETANAATYYSIGATTDVLIALESPYQL